MSSSTEPSQRLKTALQAIKGFETWTMDTIMAYRSENCIHEILPKSLSRPSMNNATYYTYFSAILPYFKDFKVQINHIIEDEKENKIAMWAQSTAVTPLSDYANEYMLVFHFNEKGDKVERFLEFVDSVNRRQGLGELRRYIAEKEGKEGKAT